VHMHMMRFCLSSALGTRVMETRQNVKLIIQCMVIKRPTYYILKITSKTFNINTFYLLLYLLHFTIGCTVLFILFGKYVVREMYM
jgi:hypothetical protein